MRKNPNIKIGNSVLEIEISLKKINSLKEFAISYRILCAIAIFKGSCCIVMCL